MTLAPQGPGSAFAERTSLQFLWGATAGRALLQDVWGTLAGRALLRDLWGATAGCALLQDVWGATAGRAFDRARWTLAISVAAVGILLTSAAGAAVNPFYIGLLHKGTDALNRKDFPAAVKALRTACFGMLDEPSTLADCLVRLGVAQAANGDRDGFRETFSRVAELEERFKVYEKAPIDAGLLARFEQDVLRLVPAATLQERPGFQRFVPTPEERVAALPPKTRRDELEKLARSEPAESLWPTMLAELELSDGDEKAAIRSADRALRLAPGDARALAVRGRAHAARKDWQEAIDDLVKTGTAAEAPQPAAALLLAYLRADRVTEAALFASSLTPAVAAEPEVSRLAAEVKLAEAEAARRAAAEKVGGSAGSGGGATADENLSGGSAEAPSPAAAPAMEQSASGQPAAAAGGAVAGSTAGTQTGTTASGSGNSGAAVQKDSAVGAAGGLAGASAHDAAAAGTPPPAPVSSEEEIARLRALLDGGKTGEAYEGAVRLADAQRDSPMVQYFAGEACYRTGHWSDGVAYFTRLGAPGPDRPVLRFYLAVCLFEAGNKDGARTMLASCLPYLRRTPFIDSYVRRIKGEE